MSKHPKTLDKITDILQRKRINENLSLYELENKTSSLGLKISAGTIQKIEKGEIIPKIDQLLILLSALGSEIEISSLLIK
ncbi:MULTISPECIES: helix-turn-helix domain-containing protein [Chryseobacterium]|uniref:Helix-turn-helix transcriptional regulator n=1 Tax=Chryseobacterium muglaense TaxID=2893752 RepID=A0ABR8MCC0_9FLAO|nr:MULTISPECIES: helix-turn-helix transcriptional regulator [Chryseobacterium]MBD3906758.1 helix-turn-helix transcriptional regulator [Chryseobacterium muglaense]